MSQKVEKSKFRDYRFLCATTRVESVKSPAEGKVTLNGIENVLGFPVFPRPVEIKDIKHDTLIVENPL